MPDRPDANLWTRAGTLLQQGHVAEAHKLYREICNSPGAPPEAWVMLGVVEERLGRLEEAAASYRQAVVIRPDYGEVYYNLGNVLRRQRQQDEAAASYRRAIELRPEFAPAYNNLGNVLREQGKLEDAAASYRRAIDLRPNYAEAFYNLGLCDQTRGAFTDAAEWYRRALELAPQAHHVLSNLSSVLIALGRPRDALDHADRALALQPGDALAMLCRAQALAGMRRFSEAAGAFEDVRRLQPEMLREYVADRLSAPRPADAEAPRVDPEMDYVGRHTERLHRCDWAGLGDLQAWLDEATRERAAVGALAPVGPFRWAEPGGCVSGMYRRIFATTITVSSSTTFSRSMTAGSSRCMGTRCTKATGVFISAR